MLLLIRVFIRALKAPPIAPSALSDFRAVGRGGASRRLWRGFGVLRGSNSAPKPRSPAPKPWNPTCGSCPSGLRGFRAEAVEPSSETVKPSPKTTEPSFEISKPNRKFPKTAQSEPKGTLWEDLAWGTWFLQGLAEKVVGLRGLRVAPRGFGWEGQQTGPQGGG